MGVGEEHHSHFRDLPYISDTPSKHNHPPFAASHATPRPPLSYRPSQPTMPLHQASPNPPSVSATTASPSHVSCPAAHTAHYELARAPSAVPARQPHGRASRSGDACPASGRADAGDQCPRQARSAYGNPIAIFGRFARVPSARRPNQGIVISTLPSAKPGSPHQIAARGLLPPPSASCPPSLVAPSPTHPRSLPHSIPRTPTPPCPSRLITAPLPNTSPTRLPH